MTSKTARLGTLVALTITSNLLTNAQAATRTWQNGAIGNWSDTMHWSDNAVPGSGDQAHLLTGGTATIDADQGTIAALILGSSQTDPAERLSAILQIDDGGNLSIGASGGTIRAESSVIINDGGVLNPTAIFNIGTTLGGGELIINNGGHFNSTGSSGTTSQLRFAVGGSTASIIVDGGRISTRQTVAIGYSNDSTATLTLKNGGHYQGLSGRLFFGATASSSLTGVSSTLNIGGETTAAAAGTIAGVTVLSGAGATNINTINFNHTSNRHEFINTGSGLNLIIQDELTVSVKSGVTVLGGANTYTRGTTIGNGATLLANYTGDASGASSTGVGSVEVERGGTFGGIGNSIGNLNVSGTLKPGDYDYDSQVSSFGVLDLQGEVTLTESATLAIGINGVNRGGSSSDGYSALDVSGDFALDGTLQITLLKNFSIVADQTLSFEIIRLTGAGALSGEFNNYLLDTQYEDLQLNWDTSEISTGWLHVSATAVPEPSNYILFGATLLLVSRRFRFKSRKS